MGNGSSNWLEIAMSGKGASTTGKNLDLFKKEVEDRLEHKLTEIELKGAAAREQEEYSKPINTIIRNSNLSDNPLVANIQSYSQWLKANPSTIKLNEHNAEELAKKRQEEAKNLSDWAGKNLGNKVVGSVGSVGTSLLSGGDYISKAVEQATIGKTLVRPGITATEATQAIRGGVSKDMGDTGKFLYNTAMSGIDSLVASVGGNGGAVLLGLSAASNAYDDIKARGGSEKQALVGGAVSGIFESLFEKFSIGNLNALKEMPVSSAKTIFQNIAKSALTNFSEEAATEIANLAYDYLVMGDLSNYAYITRQYEAQYKAQGMSATEAKAKAEEAAKRDLMKQVLEAGASGALMGVGFAGVGTAASEYGSYKAGEDLKNHSAQYDLVQLALQGDKNSQSRKMAENIASKLDASETATVGSRDIGRLSNMMAYEAEQAAEKEAKKNKTSIMDVFKPAKSKADTSAQTTEVAAPENTAPATEVEQVAAVQEANPDTHVVPTSVNLFMEAGDDSATATLKSEILARVTSGDTTLSKSQLRKLDLNSAATRAVLQSVTGQAVPQTNDTKTLLNYGLSLVEQYAQANAEKAAIQSKINDAAAQMAAQAEAKAQAAEQAETVSATDAVPQKVESSVPSNVRLSNGRTVSREEFVSALRGQDSGMSDATIRRLYDSAVRANNRGEAYPAEIVFGADSAAQTTQQASAPVEQQMRDIEAQAAAKAKAQQTETATATATVKTEQTNEPSIRLSDGRSVTKSEFIKQYKAANPGKSTEMAETVYADASMRNSMGIDFPAAMLQKPATAAQRSAGTEKRHSVDTAKSETANRTESSVEASVGTPNKAQEWTIKRANSILSKREGAPRVELSYDLGANEKGYYDAETNTLVLNGKQLTTQQELVYTLGHELVHSVDGDQRTALVNDIFAFGEKLSSAEQMQNTLDNTREKYIKFFMRKDGLTRVAAEAKVTIDYAKEEVAADLMRDIMTGTGSLKRLANENKTLLEKLIDTVEKFISRITGNSVEDKALRNEAEALVDRMYRAQGGSDKSRFSVENRAESGYNGIEETQHSKKDGAKNAGRENDQYTDGIGVETGDRNDTRRSGRDGRTSLEGGVSLSDTQRRELRELIAPNLEETAIGKSLLEKKGIDQIIDELVPTVVLSSEYDHIMIELYDGLSVEDIRSIREIAKPGEKLLANKVFTAADKEYFAALENDKRKAERMVREAAERAGYKLHQFHFTDKNFTVFRFGELGFHVGTLSQAEYVRNGRNGNVLSLYVKADSPLYWPIDTGYWSAKEFAATMDPDDSFEDFDNADEIRENIRKIAGISNEKEANAKLRKYLKSFGYDSISYENTQDRGSGDPIDISYILFDPEQLKSADVATYDDNGDVIPLSQRFDAENEDIRFSLNDGDTTVATSQSGEPVAMTQSNGSARFSISTYEEDGRSYLSNWLEKKVKSGDVTRAEADDIVKQMDEYYDLCKTFEHKYAPFGAWSNAKVVRDAKGNPAFSVIKANGDYAMNLDFSLVCKKRRTLDAVFGEMIKRGLMDDLLLEEADIAKINDIIRENGFETACALCFVDSKRYRQGKVADAFVTQYNDMVNLLIPDGSDIKADHFDFVGTGLYSGNATALHTVPTNELNTEALKKVMSENGKQTVPHKIAKHLLNNPSDRKLLTRGEFMNTDGFEAVKVKNPAVMKLYNSSKGSGGPKAAFSDVQYLGDILKKNTFTADKAYKVGGVRIQSFSDYVPRLVFDYIQMMADLSAKKLPAHAYTKEAAFAKQFGMTGVKINLSLVPAVVEGGVAPGLDANGNYAWFDGQSFGSDVNVKGSGKTGFDLAVEIQNAEGYSKNCGTIAVGISNEQIEKMLDDPDIRMIIPYHKSSLNHIVAVMNNIDQYKDYTGVQNTRSKSTGSKIDGKDFNFNEALLRTGDAKTAADEYKAWCEENDYIPKFDDFAKHENYYKLLEDFSTYDNGVAVPQGAVTMTFPKDGDAFGSMAQLIEEGLEEDAELEGRRESNVPGIVDQIEKALKSERRYSVDSEGRELSAEQQEFFKDSVVRDENGNLMVMYHGTANSGEFTVFDGNKLSNSPRLTQIGQGFYFTNVREAAEDYMQNSDLATGKLSKGKKPFLHKVYLDVKNPFNVDTDTLDLDAAKAVFMDGDYDYFFESWIPFYLNNKSVGDVTYTKAEVQSMNKAEKVSVYVDYLSQFGVKEVLSNMVRAFRDGEQSRLLDSMRNRLGYDGIVEEFRPGNFQYAVFDSAQIKRVTNINPTIDKDIRYSVDSEENTPDNINPDTGYARGSIMDSATRIFNVSGRDEAVQVLQDYINALDEIVEQHNKEVRDNRTLNAMSPKLTEKRIASNKKAIEELIEKFGKMEQTGGAQQEVNLPKKIDENTKVRGAVQTLSAHEATSEVISDNIAEEILSGNAGLTYTPVSDKETLKAVEKITKEGFKEMRSRWNAVVEGDKLPTKEDIALGEALYLQACEEKNVSEAMKLIGEISVIGTRMGQAVQAFSLLKKMTPTGKAYYLQKTVDSMNNSVFFNKRGIKITLDKALVENLLTAETTEAVQKAEDEIVADLAKQIPPTVADRIDLWRYTAMLLNPRTHVRNVIGNTLFAPLRTVKDVLATGIEAATIKDKSQRTKSVIVDSALMDFAYEDADLMKEELQGGGRHGIKDKIMSQRDIFSYGYNVFAKTVGKGLDSIAQWNSDMMENEDWGAKIVPFSDFRLPGLRSAYAKALGGFLQARGFTAEQVRGENSTVEGRAALDQARLYAIKEAQKATYRDYSKLASQISQLQRNSSGVGKVLWGGVLPFTKTPINVLRRGVEYSPVGLANTLLNGTAKLKSGKYDYTATQFIDDISAGMTGSAVVALGWFLSKIGMLIGSMGNDDEDKFEELQGYQEYSINVDGTNYTLDWAAPFALPLFVGAELNKFFESKNDGTLDGYQIMESLLGLANPLLAMSMLSGINDTIAAVQYDRESEPLVTITESILGSYAGQFIPSLGGAIARTVDDSARTNFTPSGQKGMKNWADRWYQSNILGKNPFKSQERMLYIDEWGRVDTDENILSRGFANFLSPGYANAIVSTSVDSELSRLAKVTKDSGVFPDKAAKYFNVNKEKYAMSQDEYEAHLIDRGQHSYQLVSDITNDILYAGLPDEVKAQAIKFAYEYAADMAKLNTNSEYSVTDGWKKALRELEQNGGDVAEYLMVKAQAKLNGNSGEVVQAALDMSGMSDYDIMDIVVIDDGDATSFNDPYTSKHEYILNESQQKQYTKFYRDFLAEEYGYLVSDREYQEASASEKYKMLKNVMAEVRAMTRREMSDWLWDQGIEPTPKN